MMGGVLKWCGGVKWWEGDGMVGGAEMMGRVSPNDGGAEMVGGVKWWGGVLK